MNTIQAVLFDLDGTLIDTASDLVYAINQLRLEKGLSELPLSVIRPIISLGSKHMIRKLFDIHKDEEVNQLRERFLAIYQKHLADSTQIFPNIDKVLAHLDEYKIPWGIVTNKLTCHTTAILKALQLEHRPLCIICGDSLPTYKPDPQPILHGCKLLKKAPQNCLYVGDSSADVKASKAAGTKLLVALYGYVDAEDPYTWQADGYVHEPIEIIEWLSQPK